MNETHRQFLASDEWAQMLRADLLPWLAQNGDLGTDVLELGPGPGRTTELLQGLAPHVTAVEVDPELAGALSERMAGTNVVVLNIDATDTGLESGRFSSVVSFSMFHHVPSAPLQDAVLREACRVLQVGGRLLVVDSADSPELRELHVDDTFVPLDPDDLEDRLCTAGFASAAIEHADGRVRFVATKA